MKTGARGGELTVSGERVRKSKMARFDSTSPKRMAELEAAVLHALGIGGTSGKGRAKRFDCESGVIRRTRDSRPPIGGARGDADVAQRGPSVRWEDEPATLRTLASVPTGPGPVKRAAERRTARRVPLEVPVSILVEGQVVEGVSEDISTSG